MTQPPDPDLDRIEIDGGEPNGFVVVVLDRDVDPDPRRDLADVLQDAAGFNRLLAVLGALGDPPTRRLVAPASRDAVLRLRERGRRGRRTPSRDLTRFWRIDLRDGRADPREVARRLLGLPGVELAYAESQVVAAPTVPVETAPAGPDPGPPAGAQRVAMLPQGHLRAAPEGVGAEAVRTRCGARRGGRPVRRRRGGVAAGSSRVLGARPGRAGRPRPAQPRRDRRVRRLPRHRRARDRRGDGPGRAGGRGRTAPGRGALLLALRRHHGRRTAHRRRHRAGRRPSAGRRRPAAGGSAAGGEQQRPAADGDRPRRLRGDQRRHRRRDRRRRGRGQRHPQPRPVAPPGGPAGHAARRSGRLPGASSWAAVSPR